jgi:hypothetical protein
MCVMDGGAGDGGPGDAALDAPPDTPILTNSECGAIEAGLRGCWLFEGDLRDESSYGHHLQSLMGIFQPGRVPSSQAIDVSTGLELRLESGDSRNLSSAAGTWQMWINPRTLPASGRMGLIELDGAWGLFLHPDGEIRCRFVIGGADRTLLAPAAVMAGNWHHVACVVSDGESVLYVDGTRRDDNTMVGEIPSSTGTFLIGADAPAAADHFEGTIDSVMVFDYPRSPEQVSVDAEN